VPNCSLTKSLRRELSPNSEDESPATVKFIKMSCKYFTDGMVRSLENEGGNIELPKRLLINVLVK